MAVRPVTYTWLLEVPIAKNEGGAIAQQSKYLIVPFALGSLHLQDGAKLNVYWVSSINSWLGIPSTGSSEQLLSWWVPDQHLQINIKILGWRS